MSNKNEMSYLMSMKVVFSKRAYTALLAETKEKIATETGGIFLGVVQDGIWYVVESIDPGPKSIFRTSYFEYDTDYVKHLSNKINRLYCDRLDVLGLWHRHPGSMDTFSSTDDGTILQFATQNNGITISALVNIDPKFRMTMYVATLESKDSCKPMYEQILYEINEDGIPKEIREITDYREMENQINNFSFTQYNKFNVQNAGAFQHISGQNHQVKSIDFSYILSTYLRKMPRSALIPNINFSNTDEEYELIIEEFLVDECLFCDEMGLSYVCNKKANNAVEFMLGDKNSKYSFEFYMIDFSRKDEFIQTASIIKQVWNALFPPGEIIVEAKKHLCFIFDGRIYLYTGNLLKNAWEARK